MGLAVAIIFGLYPWMILKRGLSIWPFWVLGAFWSVSVIYPKLLSPFYTVWMFLGQVLGKINSTVILSLCYFVLFVPVALFFRLIKRDRLHRTHGNSVRSFRKVREQSADAKSMENPF